MLLAIAAGSFLYVAASDLIPEIHKKSKWLNVVLTLFGILIPILVQRLID
jgi:zinc transporter ZupT